MSTRREFVARTSLALGCSWLADTEAVAHDGMGQRIAVGLGPYSVVILSQDD